jgi:hypothetical protein
MKSYGDTQLTLNSPRQAGFFVGRILPQISCSFKFQYQSVWSFFVAPRSRNEPTER